MSSGTIPVLKDTNYLKELLFQLGRPVVLPVDQFDEVWPLIGCEQYGTIRLVVVEGARRSTGAG